MEQRKAIDLSTLKFRRIGLGCYLMGKKDTLGAFGIGASSLTLGSCKAHTNSPT